MKKSLVTRRLVESAVMIAIATVLSVLSFQGPWALGGSITICSMLPLVFIAQRYGTKWGLLTGVVHGILQMFLGFSNVQYASNAITAIGIILLDYVVAFGVVGFSASFNRFFEKRQVAIVVGIAVTMFLRYVCHFLSGWLIWEALWPNEYGYGSVVWSLLYNGSYMLPEMIITAAVAALSYNPLKRYWLGQDLPQ